MLPRMAAENRLTLVRAQESRERVIAALSEHFAHDVLDVDEFERRVALAQTSESAQEIDALLADLPALALAAGDAAASSSTALAPRVAPALAAPGEVRDEQTVFAVMGGVDRRGAWTMPRRLKVVAIMGGGLLDLREARLPPGPVDIEVTAFMGGLQIIVPPGLAVETHGSAIMGGFQDVHRAPAHPDPGAPLLRVHGFVVMGGVDIQMRLSGEGDRDGRRREKRELRAQRRQEKLDDRRDRHAQRALRHLERHGHKVRDDD
jgi:hypothetical protein